MFGFLRKQKPIPYPYKDVAKQLALALKSLSLPQAQPSWKLYADRQRDWSPQVAIDEGYKASSVVYTAVEKRAKLISSVPWKVYVRKGDEWEESPNHPLQRLIDNPNPDQSQMELFYGISQSLDLTGCAFISEIKAGTQNQPKELWHLPSKHMRIKPGDLNLFDYFEYDHGGMRRKIMPEDMIYLRMPNPDSPLWGMPVLMAAGQATDIDREAGAFQKVSLQNRGLSDISIELPEGATPEQADYVRDKLKERQTGPANARAPIVSTGKVHQLNQTAVEMDFVNSRKSVWSEIAAVFGVPLAAMGFTEDVNLANAETMNKQLWQDTIIPQLELIKRQLNHQLTVEFGSDVELRFDLSNVTALQQNTGEKLDNAEKLFRMGVPFNVINQKLELGFDDIQGGDTGYIAAGLLPVGWDMDSPTLTDEQKQQIKALAYGKGKD